MKPRTAVVVALAAVLSGLGGCSAVSGQIFAEKALTTGPNGPETPADLGVPFQRVTIPSHDRGLDAYLVRAPAACVDPPAVLIYHGFNETISKWAGAQAFLYRRCVSSLVFDPTGSGDSPRPATFDRVNEDAASVYDFARAAFAPPTRLYVLGHSMGDGELLQAEPGFAPQPSGVVVADGFSSLRDFWTAHGAGAIALVIPDVWDNVQAIQRVRAPVLVIHSDADTVIPEAEAEAVYAAAPQPKTLVVVHGFAHAELRRRPSDAWWAPVLRFMGAPAVASAQ